jgi:hypothetical protein
MSDTHDDFCHLCGWWHTGLGRGFEHPPLKDPLCDGCYPPPQARLTEDRARSPGIEEG